MICWAAHIWLFLRESYWAEHVGNQKWIPGVISSFFHPLIWEIWGSESVRLCTLGRLEELTSFCFFSAIAQMAESFTLITSGLCSCRFSSSEDHGSEDFLFYWEFIFQIHSSEQISKYFKCSAAFFVPLVKYTTRKGLISFAVWSQHRQITDRRRMVFKWSKCRL